MAKAEVFMNTSDDMAKAKAFLTQLTRVDLTIKLTDALKKLSKRQLECVVVLIEKGWRGDHNGSPASTASRGVKTKAG